MVLFREPTIQPLRLNPILNTDSYKLTHWWQYPPNTRFIYSYVCSRGGFFDHSQVAGLEDIEEAGQFAAKHFSGNPKCFNYEGWNSLYAKHGGILPLRIKAVKEGSV